MRYSNLKGALLKMGFVLLCSGMVIPAATATCPAQEGEFQLPDYYPESFSGYGCIDSINYDGVVIDDRLMRFSLEATFHTPKKPTASWMCFEPGYLAHYIRNEDNEIESLWYIQNCRK